MDKLSGLASKLGGGNKSGGDAQGSGSSGNQGQEDYLDKGLDSVEQKFGGGKIDPQKMRSTNEKITDTARNQFESATGKKVPEKFSN
ncbi:hypothetical protein CBS63078_6065 [Aspergillus niger]|uniref:Contig An09c0040, genomic contig n=3 Tax=Aspergillus niger TaxID=5061 RepID=A2QT89_ASPNC|nr:uncharacterized protein An09g01230 [Aspergillus niger]XP_025451018.1 uncharacterized protein BO96DRAFT_415158 [Aspergillus niger CBS 101883]RDH18997.1 hypothetical protein M747DRAFT_371624 [Aspergillus niger ATCC 13496]KAI2816409.1 hypothetical protein CBS115989_6910 [Aspergillus niger]KAI2827552.1 hypothetical protein CBS133816_6322 [Aspergillus niger]KAI2841123.1 hypothetical protein CBS11350_6557 [Aspergillus niger]KAI2854743.1 hypothetical protein CBS11232_4830 [Aspergillus niger]|eukprot:XP_001393441.1 hypothetical protein ANI_1_124084 [Aspergillus niger CBS 513.88]